MNKITRKKNKKYQKTRRIRGGDGDGDKYMYLYRSAPDVSAKYGTTETCLQNVMKCSDTDKMGIYFGNMPILAIAMSLEYNKLMDIGIFKIKRDKLKPLLKKRKGKYAYRQMHPERYFTSITKKFIPNVPLLPEENVPHFDCDILPLKNKTDLLLPDAKNEELRAMNSCEIFLTEKEIKEIKLKLHKVYRFNPDVIKTPADLLEYIETNDYPFDMKKYVKDGVFVTNS